MAYKLLIVDDEPDYFDGFAHRYQREYVIEREVNPTRAIGKIAAGGWDLVSFDLDYNGDGYERGLKHLLPKALEKAKGKFPIVVVTSDSRSTTKLRANENGAVKLLDKAYSTPQIIHEQFQKILKEFNSTKTSTNHEFLVFSERMQEIKKRLSLLINYSHLPVLITGEAGVGKEVAARYLHHLKNVGEDRFRAINLTTLKGDLFRSELFGHLKGSFTGAHEDKAGLVTQAEGGTLFLDEIGEISESQQVQLLRVVQEREYEPVGGNESFKLDTQLVFATNKNLAEAVAKGNFRRDFHDRINSIPIEIPPLRERMEEIMPLAEHFFAKVCHENHPAYGNSFELSITDAIKNQLYEYFWPGNIRELANAVQRLTFEADLQQTAIIDTNLVPNSLLNQSPPSFQPSVVTNQLNTVAFEKPSRLDDSWTSKKKLAYHDLENIERALIKEGGRKIDAAKTLGFENEQALYYRVKTKYYKKHPELFEFFSTIRKIYKL